MKLLSTKAHGYLDHTLSVLMIVSPWLFGIRNNNAATILILGGIVSTICNLLTNYEAGILGQIKVSRHLKMDVFSGIILASTPWVFGFADQVFLPHLLFGLSRLLIALTTRTSGAYRQSFLSAYRRYEMPSYKARNHFQYHKDLHG